MSSEICSRENCTGCSTCASICPRKCIDMIPDDEGFLRPVIKYDNCVNCGVCKEKCPANNLYLDDKSEPETYAIRVNDEDILKNSSSGGFFSSIAIPFLKRKDIVIGAGFDENLQVVHKVCMDLIELDDLRKSKYVQSKIGVSYIEAKKYLDEGKDVLFCGTPCQIGGLRAFLGKNYDNLYLIDFICHGVPSPLAYNRYLDYLKSIYKSDVKQLDFRNKQSGWHNYSFSVVFQNGQLYNNTVSQDYYLHSFIMNMNLRPSCYQCRFKHIHRQSDITIADYWGVENHFPKWADDKGVSLVMIHTEKGKQLFDSCCEMFDNVSIPFCDAVENNPSMTCSVRKPGLRDCFMKDILKLKYDKLHRKYCGTNIISRVRRKISRIINL